MSSDPILRRISASGSRHGDRPALSSRGNVVSYNELFSIARGIRDAIVEHGLVQPRRIGIVTGDDPLTYASLLAAWSLGAAYVPLNVHHPADRNTRIIEQARLDVILTSRERKDWAGHLPAYEGSPVVLSTMDVSPGQGPLQFPDPAASDLAYIFFTSGSTGMPKGVPITHGNLSAFMETVLTGMHYGFRAEDRFLQMFELTFDLSVISILAPWCVGGCCCIVPERGIAYMNILNTLANEKVTVALMVPSVLPYLQRFFDEVRLPDVRLNQFCGEALMQAMASEWSQCVPNARIENVYGPTEATIYCTRYEWKRAQADAESVHGIVPIGRAMPGTRTLVVDDEGQPCEPGVRGELCLAGDQVMSGYWDDLEKTAASFVRMAGDGTELNAYRTGDIAYVNENGNLIYCGRRDSQVKIDGHRVELGEIEHFARQYIGSSAAAVVMSKSNTGTNRLNLFVGGGDIDRAGLEEYLKANLPAYMWPSDIRMLPELPLNLNGKIDRPKLARLAGENVQR